MGQLEWIGRAYLSWASAHPTHFQIVSSRNLIDFENSSRARDLNDEIRERMVALFSMAQDRGELSAGVQIDTAVLSSRAFVYGLARMFVDGHFPEWQPKGDPIMWMERALRDFILRLRQDH